MENDRRHLDIQLSKQQMINLIIHRKNIEAATEQFGKVTISEPTSSNYNINSKTKFPDFIVICKISLKDKTFDGRLEVTTEDGKTYKGQVVYQGN